MKKNSTLLIIALFFVNVCALAHNTQAEAAFKNAVKMYNTSMRTSSIKYKNCTPFKEDGFTIYGISNGKCHYSIGTITYNGKAKPLTDCYAPMSVMRQVAEGLVASLKEDSISSTSAANILNKYCKSINTTTTIHIK